MLSSSRVLVLLGLLSAVGCAASTDESGPGQTEDDLTSLSGAYWIEPQTAAPKDDTIFAIEFNGGKKVRVLFGYMGETYIRKSCVGTFVFAGKSGASRTLDVTCPADVQPTKYPIVSVAADSLVLQTPKTGTKYTLHTTRGIQGTPHFTCTSEKFKATLDVVGSGSARRVFFSSTAPKPPKGAPSGSLFGVPYDEALWIESNGKGHDLQDNDYVLSLPAKLTGHVSATLTYTDEMQFYPQPVKHQLSCDPS
jgi:hypothetical protein